MSQSPEIPDVIRTSDLMRAIALACIEFPESIWHEVQVIDEHDELMKVTGIEHDPVTDRMRIYVKHTGVDAFADTKAEPTSRWIPGHRVRGLFVDEASGEPS